MLTDLPMKRFSLSIDIFPKYVDERQMNAILFYSFSSSFNWLKLNGYFEKVKSINQSNEPYWQNSISMRNVMHYAVQHAAWIGEFYFNKRRFQCISVCWMIKMKNQLISNERGILFWKIRKPLNFFLLLMIRWVRWY